MNLLFLLLFLITPLLAPAGGSEGIPTRFVFFQVFNFSLFVLALFYLLRKKIPVFLQQKKKDFLEYKEKALALEKQNQSAYLLTKEKTHSLRDKEKNLESDVAKALDSLKKEWELEEEQKIKNLKSREEQELKRVKIKALHGLKNQFLSTVLQKTKDHLLHESSAESLEKLNHQMIQKWEKI